MTTHVGRYRITDRNSGAHYYLMVQDGRIIAADHPLQKLVGGLLLRTALNRLRKAGYDVRRIDGEW